MNVVCTLSADKCENSFAYEFLCNYIQRDTHIVIMNDHIEVNMWVTQIKKKTTFKTF
jgi:hypothetical protein